MRKTTESPSTTTTTEWSSRFEIPAADADQYEELAHVCGGSGYDWDDIALMRDKTSQILYYVTDSGCSCSHWWEDSVFATPVQTWQEWAAKAQAWAGNEHEKVLVLEAIEKLNQLRPNPSPKVIR